MVINLHLYLRVAVSFRIIIMITINVWGCRQQVSMTNAFMNCCSFLDSHLCNLLRLIGYSNESLTQFSCFCFDGGYLCVYVCVCDTPYVNTIWRKKWALIQSAVIFCSTPPNPPKINTLSIYIIQKKKTKVRQKKLEDKKKHILSFSLWCIMNDKTNKKSPINLLKLSRIDCDRYEFFAINFFNISTDATVETRKNLCLTVLFFAKFLIIDEIIIISYNKRDSLQIANKNIF